MGLFTSARLDWTQPEVQELHHVLTDVYWDKDEVRTITQKAGLHPADMPQARNVRLMWHGIMDELARRGKVIALIETASQDAATAAATERLEGFLSETTTTLTARGPALAPARAAEVSMDRRAFDQRLLQHRRRFAEVARLRDLLDLGQSVARLTFVAGGRRYFGTGVLIAPSLLLTSHHNTVDEAGNPITSMKVEFSYTAEPNPAEDNFRWTGAAPVGEAAHDWAVIELDRDATLRTDGRPKRATVVLGSDLDMVAEDTLFIVGHPSGLPQQLSMSWQGVHDLDEARVRYLVDTEVGSSGSPVFNSSTHVVALHHQAVFLEREDLWANQGVMMGKIVAGLEAAGVPHRSRQILD